MATEQVTPVVVGRRKEAVARVYLTPGTGRITVNGKDWEEYFPRETIRTRILQPLAVTELKGQYDIHARIEGGGVSGQAGALQHALARALLELDGGLRPNLKKAGLLRRDPRMKERRKYGLKKARRAPQYSKR